MIWYNPLTGTSCARGDVIQRTAAERTVNPTVLCFVILPPARRCRPPTGRSCCTTPLQTDAILPVLDPPTVPMTADVCLYDNCQTVNVNTAARHGSNITGSEEVYQGTSSRVSPTVNSHRRPRRRNPRPQSPGLFTPPGFACFTPFSIKALQVILLNHENPHTFRAAMSPGRKGASGSAGAWLPGLRFQRQ